MTASALGRLALGRLASRAFLILVFAFLVCPLVYVALGSLSEATLAFPPQNRSLGSYADIPTTFLDALRVSLIVAAASTCLAIPLGLGGAIGVVRGRFAGRDLVNGFLMSPLLLPMLILGVGLYQLYASIDRIAGTSLAGSLLGLILGHTSFCIPYVTRAVIPALTQLPVSLEEAAYDLGASRSVTFTQVTLPMVRTGLVGGAAFAFLTSFDNFPVSLFLAEGDNATLPIVMYQFIEFDLKPAILAMSTLIIVFSLAAMLLVERSIGLAAFMGLREH